jgi:exosome complex RNA-binding protein Csl4
LSNTSTSQRLKIPVKERVPVLPGDRLATIEEFAPGSNATTQGETVTSTKVGYARLDLKNRIINVDPANPKPTQIPKVGDLVIGLVESAQSSIAQVKIEAINDDRSDKSFAGMISFREETRRSSVPPVKSADILRARVFSTKNSIFHLALDCPSCGVIYTVCSNCGGNVVALSRFRIKCKECGMVDDRLLSEEFLKFSRSSANSR